MVTPRVLDSPATADWSETTTTVTRGPLSTVTREQTRTSDGFESERTTIVTRGPLGTITKTWVSSSDGRSASITTIERNGQSETWRRENGRLVEHVSEPPRLEQPTAPVIPIRASA